jgi:hypothetical protein
MYKSRDSSTKKDHKSVVDGLNTVAEL